MILLNHDISPHVEHEDIKRFKREVAEYIGLPVTYANMPGWETTPPLAVAVANKGFKKKRRSDIMNAMGYKAVFPLADWERTIWETEEVGITRPSTYATYKHANCIGCLKAGKQHWYCVYCLRPDIWGEAKAAEKDIGHSIIKGVYLKELEPEFKEMRDTLHIVPTDKTSSARFWKQVREAMPEEQLEIPCDCSF